MNTTLLNKYKQLEIPCNAAYKNESDKEAKFREQDSPLAFLDLTEYKQEQLLNWCASLDKIQAINSNYSSYGLKHMFGKEKNGSYLPNGALKGAMLLAGFRVADLKELNWRFNISEKSINKIIKRIYSD